MQILIAHPDPAALRALGGLARAWGYQPLGVPDGSAALAVLSSPGSPRLALIAWEMPGVDGGQVCRALRASEDPGSERFLILLTERRGQALWVPGLEAGADDFAAIPPEPAELRARLHVGRRLLELQDGIRERDRYQSALRQARAMCHDLNQPLQVARGWTDLILTDLAADDPNHDALEGIRSAVQRSGELTRELLTLTRAHTRGAAPGSRHHLAS